MTMELIHLNIGYINKTGYIKSNVLLTGGDLGGTGGTVPPINFRLETAHASVRQYLEKYRYFNVR